MKKILNLLLIATLLVGASCSSSNKHEDGASVKKFPRKEMRAVWLTTAWGNDWPKGNFDIEGQKQLYRDYLEAFKAANINTVFVQVRPMADAIYPSEVSSPWSEYVSGRQGVSPGYDVLEFMVEETHNAGMELHAWLNPYRVSSNTATFKPSKDNIALTHPELTVPYFSSAKSGDEYVYTPTLWLNPALQEVRDYFIDVVDEIITKYDVDGIHLDDYFYPYKAVAKEFPDTKWFDEQKDLENGFKDLGDWRRNNVDLMVEQTHKAIKAARPSVKFSISPFGVWRNNVNDPLGSSTNATESYDELYADTRKWCEKGWMDFVVPQLYNSTGYAAMDFRRLVEWWPRNSFDVKVVVGYSISKFTEAGGEDGYKDALEFKNQFFHADLRPGIYGGVFYSARDLQKPVVRAILQERYAHPAVMPVFGNTSLPAPKTVLPVAGGKTLSWTDQGADVRYVVYKMTNKGIVVSAIINEASFTVADAGEYAVSAINKENVESDVSDFILVN